MENMFRYLNRGVSAFHAVKESKRMLQSSGFEELQEMDRWKLEKGKGYYVTRNESSIIAFMVPDCPVISAYHMTASHSDSPTFRVKKEKVENRYYAKAHVEGYGGMIMSSWFDRPLTVAGRAVVNVKGKIESRLLHIDRDLLVIPNLAIHFNREINNGYKYNPHIDMQPLYGNSGNLLEVIAEHLELEVSQIIDYDLYLVVRQRASKLGVAEEFFMSPRIDDLACAYVSLRSFCKAVLDRKKTSIMPLWCMFDNEEVGSGTRQGALGTFLPDVMARIEKYYKMDCDDSIRAKSSSLLLSVDNAHALHPNLQDKSDSEFPVVVNGGIVVKYSASQKYTTTATTAAVFESLCLAEGIGVQRFANRADVPGGSTLGNLLSQQVSVPMVDIGLPQFAMHSAVETAGCEDVRDMYKALKAFYGSEIVQCEDGKWSL